MAVKCILTGQTPSVLDGVTENVQTQLNDKVDKVTGKGLSTNDYTSAEKTKLSGIETGAQKNTITGVKGSAETTYRTGNVNITATNIGLGNVNNTSDAEKPISNATQAALNGKQSKITANGFLKGDGTGGITADKPVFYVTITGTVASPTADKTPAEIYQAYENGYAVYANVTLTGSSSSTNLKGLLPLTYVLAGIDAQYAITFSSTSGKEIKEVCYSPAIRKWEVPYSGVIATKDDLPSTPGSIGAQSKITAKGLLKGNGNGSVVAAVKGTDYFTPTDVNEIAAEAAKKVDVSGKLDKTGNGSNVTAAFTAASTRANIATGEKLSVLFGKIAKWFADLGSLAFKSTVAKSDLANDVKSDLSSITNKVSKSGDTMTGKLTVPQVETGTGNSNFFQCRKFRGEGDADTYYHAIDFGYQNHDHVDFHEYGGIWSFYKNQTGKVNDGVLCGKITSNGWEGRAKLESGSTMVTSQLTENSNAIATTAFVHGLVDGLKPKPVSVTLPASGWNANAKTQTVSVAGVTATANCIITAAPDSYMAYANAGVRCTAQGAGTLTFACETVPTADVAANVLILG